MKPTNGRATKVRWFTAVGVFITPAGPRGVMRATWLRSRHTERYGVPCEEVVAMTKPTGGLIRCIRSMPKIYHRSAN